MDRRRKLGLALAKPVRHKVEEQKPAATKQSMTGEETLLTNNQDRTRLSMGIVREPKKAFFSRIFTEKHEMKRSDSQGLLARSNQPPITRVSTQGIVTRALSRSKLELFLRPDPDQSVATLRSRIIDIVKRASETPTTKKQAWRPINRSTSNKPKPRSILPSPRTLKNHAMGTHANQRLELVYNLFTTQ